MATLTHVSRQWASRPSPERFYDVQDILPLLSQKKKYERSALFPTDQIGVLEENEDIYLALPGVTTRVRLNNWTFTQLCKQLGGNPQAYTKLPARLVAPIFEHQLKHFSGVSSTEDVEFEETPTDEPTDDSVLAMLGDFARETARDTRSKQLNVLFAPNVGGLEARSIESATYGRYSDIELANDALRAVECGWRTPRALAVGDDPRNRIATPDDEMKCSLIKAGMKIGPAGVYYSDRNMFIFLASDLEVLPGHFRFVTLENSEVGESRKLQATFGLMNYVCMNHILWGVSNVHRVEKKHRRGSVGKFSDEFMESLELVTKSETVPESLYKLARERMLGKNRVDVIKNVYARRNPSLGIQMIERALDCAESNPGDADGASPYSVWGFVQGITRAAQLAKFADKRMDIDRAAGALLDELKLEDGPVTVATQLELPAPVKSGRKPKNV